jgi:hypothetical protein
MLLRLMPRRGGDRAVHGIIAMNDTDPIYYRSLIRTCYTLGTYKGILAGNGMLKPSVQIVQRPFTQRLRYKFS